VAGGLIAIVVIVSGLSVIGFYGFRYIEAKYHPPRLHRRGHGSVTFRCSPGLRLHRAAAGQGGSGGQRPQTFVSRPGLESTRRLEPGYFRLRKRMNAEAAWNLLVADHADQTTVTIPEGLRLSQIINKLGSSTASRPAHEAAAKNVAALSLPSALNGSWRATCSRRPTRSSPGRALPMC
jgi:UPF0755 protein